MRGRCKIRTVMNPLEPSRKLTFEVQSVLMLGLDYEVNVDEF